MLTTPFILVLFGATGDLAHARLIPALFSLFKEKQLPETFYIIGFARRVISDKEFSDLFSLERDPRLHEDKSEVTSKTHKDDSAWGEFVKHLSYQSGKFEEAAGYRELIEKLEKIDHDLGACVTRIFYLATPPSHYENILDNLRLTKLSEGCGQGSTKWTRIGIEKPFGKDVKTAKMLEKKLSDIFEERQIFRVDHYLGKETVQNLLVFRFANSIFEPIWNKDYIDHVQLTWMEKEGLSRRGKFFDGVGLLRDVGQNHLMQLLASVVMEMPKSFQKEEVRNARVSAIQSIECIRPEMVVKNVVRGQYEGYTTEPDVNRHSQTETYIAAKFFINSPRFAGVPFYMRAGKATGKNIVKISIIFKQTCHILFKEIGCPEEGNVLTIRIQPNEGLYFKIIAKKPGTDLALETAEMHFSYNEAFGTQGAEAYSRLLRDIITGDQMLFNRSDELVSSWEFITDILEGWKRYNPPIEIYKKGTMGPDRSDDLLAQDKRKWL